MGRIKNKLQQNTLKEVLSGIRMIAGNKASNVGAELTREKAKSSGKKKKKKIQCGEPGQFASTPTGYRP